jgi:hypothetical protein
MYPRTLTDQWQVQSVQRLGGLTEHHENIVELLARQSEILLHTHNPRVSNLTTILH